MGMSPHARATDHDKVTPFPAELSAVQKAGEQPASNGLETTSAANSCGTRAAQADGPAEAGTCVKGEDAALHHVKNLLDAGTASSSPGAQVPASATVKEAELEDVKPVLENAPSNEGESKMEAGMQRLNGSEVQTPSPQSACLSLAELPLAEGALRTPEVTSAQASANAKTSSIVGPLISPLSTDVSPASVTPAPPLTAPAAAAFSSSELCNKGFASDAGKKWCKPPREASEGECPASAVAVAISTQSGPSGNMGLPEGSASVLVPATLTTQPAAAVESSVSKLSSVTGKRVKFTGSSTLQETSAGPISDVARASTYCNADMKGKAVAAGTTPNVGDKSEGGPEASSHSAASAGALSAKSEGGPSEFDMVAALDLGTCDDNRGEFPLTPPASISCGLSISSPGLLAASMSCGLGITSPSVLPAFETMSNSGSLRDDAEHSSFSGLLPSIAVGSAVGSNLLCGSSGKFGMQDAIDSQTRESIKRAECLLKSLSATASAGAEGAAVGMDLQFVSASEGSMGLLDGAFTVAVAESAEDLNEHCSETQMLTDKGAVVGLSEGTTAAILQSCPSVDFNTGGALGSAGGEAKLEGTVLAGGESATKASVLTEISDVHQCDSSLDLGEGGSLALKHELLSLTATPAGIHSFASHAASLPLTICASARQTASATQTFECPAGGIPVPVSVSGPMQASSGDLLGTEACLSSGLSVHHPEKAIWCKPVDAPMELPVLPKLASSSSCQVSLDGVSSAAVAPTGVLSSAVASAVQVATQVTPATSLATALGTPLAAPLAALVLAPHPQPSVGTCALTPVPTKSEVAAVASDKFAMAVPLAPVTTVPVSVPAGTGSGLVGMFNSAVATPVAAAKSACVLKPEPPVQNPHVVLEKSAEIASVPVSHGTVAHVPENGTNAQVLVGGECAHAAASRSLLAAVEDEIAAQVKRLHGPHAHIANAEHIEHTHLDNGLVALDHCLHDGFVHIHLEQEGLEQHVKDAHLHAHVHRDVSNMQHSHDEHVVVEHVHLEDHDHNCAEFSHHPDCEGSNVLLPPSAPALPSENTQGGVLVHSHHAHLASTVPGLYQDPSSTALAATVPGGASAPTSSAGVALSPRSGPTLTYVAHETGETSGVHPSNAVIVPQTGLGGVASTGVDISALPAPENGALGGQLASSEGGRQPPASVAVAAVGTGTAGALQADSSSKPVIAPSTETTGKAQVAIAAIRPAPSRASTKRYHATVPQLASLTAAFDQNQSPSAETLVTLSENTGMPLPNLVLWFKNRRARATKKNSSTPTNGRRSYVKSGIYSKKRSVVAARASKISTATMNIPQMAPLGGQLPVMSALQMSVVPGTTVALGGLPVSGAVPAVFVPASQGSLGISGPSVCPTLPSSVVPSPGMTVDIPVVPTVAAGPSVPSVPLSVCASTTTPVNGVATAETIGPSCAGVVVTESAVSGGPAGCTIASATDVATSEQVSSLKRGCPDDAEGHPEAKRAKTDYSEVLGELNPCHGWDCETCLKKFFAFLALSTSSRCGEQIEGVKSAAKRFFDEEMQSGLTLTSAVQTLAQSLTELERVMDVVVCESGAKLSSGPRVILREFVAQIRSGRAAVIAEVQCTPVDCDVEVISVKPDKSG